MWLKFPAPPEHLSKNVAQKSAKKPGLVATIGSFDGLHIGHQSLLRVVKESAKSSGLESAIITFRPHPIKVLRGIFPKKLASFRQIVNFLQNFGINNLIVLPFNKRMAQLEAAEFVDNILIARLNVRHLVIGPFASLGKNRKGDAAWICDYMRSKGLTATLIEPLEENSQRVSSNSIREMVASAQIEKVANLLGRPFAIKSRVLHGSGIGHKLGFPTANLKIDDYVKPPYGVYFCQASMGDSTYFALANFGLRPTFGEKIETLEALLLDYKGPDFYGEWLELKFLKRLRDEKQFKSKEELVAQIKLDVKAARDLIEKRK